MKNPILHGTGQIHKIWIYHYQFATISEDEERTLIKEETFGFWNREDYFNFVKLIKDNPNESPYNIWGT